MKNKSAVLFVLGMLGILVGTAYAAPGVRGAKPTIMLTGAGTIGISTGPAVLYSVLVGTGAITDFVVFFDSASAKGLSSILQTDAVGYKTRVFPNSTTAPTYLVFDPPLQFNKGIMASNATSLITTLVTFEQGRNQGGQ